MRKIENIQLLYTLLEVYNSQNLSKAGRTLGKTPSSVSKDISKLREQLDNPLFVRSDNRMLPTEYVTNVAPKIEQILTDLNHTLTSTKTITTENYSNTIKVAITHILMELYGDEISLQLSRKFPCADIELMTWDSLTNQKIQDEEIDFGIHLNLVCHPGKIRYRRITESKTVVICPYEDTKKSLEQLTQERKFMFLRLKDWNDVETNFFDIATMHGLSIKRACVVDNLSTAIKLINREKLCFIVPKIIAEYYRSPYIDWLLPSKGLVIGLYHHTQQNEMLTNIFYSIVSTILKQTPTKPRLTGGPDVL